MKKITFPILMVLVSLILPFLCTNGFAQSSNVDRYLEVLGSSALLRKIDAAKQITQSGITDPRLFDFINKELLNKYSSSSGPDHIDYMAWLCKALASSGSQKYRSTLENIANTTTDKLKKYAEQSISMISEYAERNKIMASDKYSSPDRDPEVSRLLNMLKSNNMNLKRDAAKTITRNTYEDPVVYETINEELTQNYSTAIDKTEIDTMAWLCKALASSGNHIYKETLQDIASNADNPKLTKYANKALGMME